jgi:hypothetical protein
MHLQAIMNKNPSRAHIESEFDLLDVAGKLMKYMVLSSKKSSTFLFGYPMRIFLKRSSFSFLVFWSQGILEIKEVLTRALVMDFFHCEKFL